MNRHLQSIVTIIQQDENLTAEQKNAILESLKEADRELEITHFKLDRTEKVKKTTAILLEETIAELEQKRKAVEGQNRELEIETALERVRAKTMAMQKSDELMETAVLLFDQLNQLGENIERTIIGVINEEEHVVDLWATRPDGSQMEKMQKFPIDEPIVMQKIYDAWRQQKKSLVIDLQGEELERYFQFLKSRGARTKRENFGERRVENFAFFSKGMLGVISADPKKPGDVGLYERFAGVFDLTYTRFLDLKHAEAQAREAQIQLALERVRSKAMAMHHSDALSEVLSVLFEQFEILGIHPVFAHLSLFDLENNKLTLRITGKGGQRLMAEKIVSLDAMDVWKEELAQWKAGAPSSISCLHYPTEMFSQVWDLLGDIFSLLPEGSKISQQDFPNGLYTTQGNCKFGYIGFNHSRPSTEEEKNILARFSTEFGRLYQRFLDLQKAEAQGREAQIELGLERVRARAMAMRNSDELNELIGTVFTELTKLDLVLTRCVIMIYDPLTNGVRWWMANSEAPSMPMSFFVKYHELPFFQAYLKGWKERTIKWQYILEGKAKIELDNFIFTETELSLLPGFIIAGMRAPDRVYLNASFNNFGNLTLASLEPLCTEHFDILLRFAKVFDLTYTRFNDLKQAEAQARESQIQLALERVRARTMAMQHSDELKDAAALLFQQVKALGVPAYSCGYNIWENNEKVFTSWMSTQDGSDFNAVRNIPLNEDANFIRYVESKKKGEQFFVLELRGERMQEHYQYLKTIPAFKAWFDYAVQMGFTLPETQIHHLANFSQGNLLFITLEPCPEFHEIFKRFAAVFEQTYTRFVDLQKAEAQAREAQIEVALEKVRSRTMGMQHSNELPEAANLLFLEVQALGIPSWSAGYNILADDKKSSTCIMSSEGQVQSAFQLPFANSGEPSFAEWLQAIENEETFFVQELSGKAIEDHYNYMKTLPQVGPVIKELEDAGLSLPTYQVNHLSFFNGGFLLFITYEQVPHVHDIFKRFTKVFEQTYTRFLDLQKAEAQSREAQIQLALERVRATTMAMQKSDELLQASQVLFEQFRQLGQHPDQLTIGIMNELDGIVEVNGTLHGQQLPTVFRHPISEPYVMNKVFNAWKAGERALMLQLSADELEAYNHFRNKLVGKEMFATHVVADQKRVIYASYFSNGMIAFGDIEQPSSETRDILDRFAKVFEQTYTRFLDLQNAEAQAREAQIEAALERVRSKTMAMHKSEELPGAATLLFQQIQILKIPAFAAGYCIWEEEKQAITLWMSSEGVLQPPFKAPTTEDELFIQMRKGFEEGKSLHVVEMGGEELVAHYRYMRTLPVVGDIFDSILEAGHPLPTFQIMHQAYFSRGFLLFITYEPVPEAHDIFKRFAKVFEQTYTRFLDLQKAEAQAREAQIELGLERVRAKAMAMQKTDDLAGAVAIIFEELDKLDIGILRCGIGIINKENRSVNVWTTSKSAENTPVQISGDESMDTHPLLQGAFNAWLKQEDYSYVLQGPDLNNYYKTQVTANFKLPESQSLVEGHEDICQYYFVAMFQAGGLFAFRDEPFSDEAKLVMKRFATVFNLTYKRFLDLQKAEAQAREAQIELALERVRARAMAMQKSDELADAAQLLYHEFGTLGINTFTCGYQFIKEEKNTQTAWVVLPDGTLLPNFIDFPLTGDPVLDSRYKDWKENVPLHIFEIYGEANKAHHRFLSDYVPPFVVQDIFSRIPDRVTFYCANFSEGYLFIIATQPLSQDEEQTIIRFAKVFEMTYTRFLDLQKAEAQTREAQIEASLERLRSKTMAMHNSEDVADTVAAMFDELVKLGIETVRCGIAIIHDINQMEVWTAKPGNDGKVSLIIGNLGMTMHPMLLQVHDSWKNKESHTSYELVGEDLKDYFKTINNSPNYPIRYDVEALPYRQINNAYYFPEGALFAFSNQPVSVESSNILKRFAGVFGQTYRRFLDLQKAESQAREATIEAALEKVRGKAMAMHNSNDISITASLVFTELRKLGITPIRCGVGLLNKQSRRGQLYSATSSADGDSLSLVGWVELSGHPVLQNIYDTWDKNKEYYPELSGEELKSYYESLLSGIAVPVPRWQSGQKQYGTFLPFTVGCLYAWSAAPYNNEEIKILKRFASIIDLTFRRYMELQTSETNAREAVKQSALDRIRADIASMRTITDLERITPLIWNELTVLGIPFIRCGIFIMDDSQGLIHTFLSTPEGKAIAAFHLPYTTPGNIAQVLKHWQNKKAYIDHWDESAFTEFADILVEQGGLASAEQYLKTIPHGGFYLHFLPFLQGMLYVGNTAQLGEDELRLIQSVAEAFSTAYARYEDFNKLEAAKKQVDSTLNELQATQKQLIQSEKMASLGELTAGIAHEIQNPLNFVNNFSEVSTELLEEMITELKNNNKEDAIVIAADVKQNLEKILHHGKRADGIVKGMLQHSRTSSAVKESTDINKLADEYLRLAYHGLRAKDNFFNATIKTDYEDSLGNINIIPQDIGRVILNLITNAFYAVTEKRKQGTNGYEPIVAISTKKFDDKVELKVSDNGIGIPEKIKEKIFNPFFTTKPTGQGTGLGLSLSYDIVKAHGGEITVKSKNGEGSEFTINLPIT